MRGMNAKESVLLERMDNITVLNTVLTDLAHHFSVASAVPNAFDYLKSKQFKKEE